MKNVRDTVNTYVIYGTAHQKKIISVSENQMLTTVDNDMMFIIKIII